MNIESVLNNDICEASEKILSFIPQAIISKPIVVYGAGNLGKKMIRFFLKEGNNVLAIVDNDETKWNDSIEGIKIISTSKSIELFSKNAIFVICIWSPSHSYAQTKQKLTEAGVLNIIHAASAMQVFPDKLLPYYHFQKPSFFLNHKIELENVFNRLADEESRKQFLAHLNCRVTLQFENLPKPDFRNQYFPNDIICLGQNEVFLDAGAYDGDTLKDFCNRTNFKFKKYIALEPDPINNKKLLENSNELNKKNANIDVYAYAVGPENTVLKFDATGGEGAGISLNGNLNVDCIKIDDKFYSEGLTFLKFDIEGGELGALIGAEKSIRKFKPVIAVCIYHKPEDFWGIPLKILEFNDNYKLFVRTHSLDGFECVMYAVDNNSQK